MRRNEAWIYKAIKRILDFTLAASVCMHNSVTNSSAGALAQPSPLAPQSDRICVCPEVIFEMIDCSCYVQDQLSLHWGLGKEVDFGFLNSPAVEKKKGVKSFAVTIHDLVHFNLEHLILVFLKDIYKSSCQMKIFYILHLIFVHLRV